jgi:tight adherence protein C
MSDLIPAFADVFETNSGLILLMAAMLFATVLSFLAINAVTTYNRVQGRTPGPGDGAADSAASLPARLSGPLSRLARLLGSDAQVGDATAARVLRSKLTQAGFYSRQAVPLYFLIRVAGLLIFGGFVSVGVWHYSELAVPPAAVLTMVAAMIGYIAPSFVLDRRIGKLRVEHRIGFPDFMDLMVVCSQAGLSMEASLARIADELQVAFPSLAHNLDMTTSEIRNGKSLSRAIESLAGRLGIDEAHSFSTLLQQSEELGSSLTRSLRAFSDDMRNKRLMKAEEKAYSLPAKLVVPLTLFVFPVLLVVLMLPIVISVSGAKL